MSLDLTTFAENKALFVGITAGLFLMAQFFVPYDRSFENVLKNWPSNFALGLVNFFTMSFWSSALMWWLVTNAENMSMGLNHLPSLPTAWRVILSVVVLDLTSYLWHRANHQWHWLWRFHAVHHTDHVLDASTAWRFHPGEVLISFGLRLTVIFVGGLSIEGLWVFEVMFASFNLFEHANLRLPPQLEQTIGMVFVTPSLHRKHHSQVEREQKSNFGTIFSFWDRLGRTFSETTSLEVIKVGLSSRDQEHRSFWELLSLPFRNR